ncbi:MAG TPA: glycosyltransferase family 2 protein [Sphingomicrobium sp.]|nr:glycosyltransferase family 2 protein [Sphingomicrobium sp.]
MTALIAILLAPLALLTTFFVVEVLAGLSPTGATRRGPSGATAVVIVPAHDEEAVIGETLARLKEAVGDEMRILVVADNCTDSTAEHARLPGVDVVERNDPDLRGKGHALAFAADRLADVQPDVLVVLDADCTIDGSSLRALVEAAASSGRPAQAINLLKPDRAASPLVQLSTFAFMLKNLVRQRGLQRLAGRVHLTGTGMAMPFGLFRASAEVRSSIVEDLALGLELAGRGCAPQLVEDAFVWSGGSSEQGTLIQRRRWEGGFLATAARYGPKTILAGSVLAGLDLLVPPLALFAALNLVALAVAAVVTLVSGAAWWPIVVQAFLLAGAGGAVLAAWVREGRLFVSLGVLARIPLYVLWKLPMYLGFARRGAPDEWLRTGR